MQIVAMREIIVYHVYNIRTMEEIFAVVFLIFVSSLSFLESSSYFRILIQTTLVIPSSFP